MLDFILKYWLEWLFGILITVLTLVVRKLSARIKQQQQEGEALRDGMRSLLRRQMEEDCESALRDGWCSTERKNTIGAMYEAYHALGGNGGVTSLKAQLMDLPAVEPDKKGV